MSGNSSWDGLSWSEIHRKANLAQREMDFSLEKYIAQYGKTKRAIETRDRVNSIRWTLDLLRKTESIVGEIEGIRGKIKGKQSKQVSELLDSIDNLIKFIKS